MGWCRNVLTLASITLCVSVCWSFNLTILHTNDVHARIEEANRFGGACSPQDSKDGKCFGGAARVRTMVNMKRAEYKNTLLLDAGDQFQGTLWYFRFGGIISARFMNLIGYDAMALGNHEFDEGAPGLIPFAQNLTFPLLCANGNFSTSPELEEAVKKHAILEVGGERIGIVGYTTKETSSLSKPGSITFNQELGAVQAEVDILQAQGINKIIALGHAGFNFDVDMAKHLSGVDLVVGGHTNTFLYTGNPPSDEVPYDKYPTMVTGADGNQVLVVQDYSFAKYLGELHLIFDDAGNLTYFQGNPILLNSSVPKDNETMELIGVYLPELMKFKEDVIGQSKVDLPDDSLMCQVTECNLGNFVADAFLSQNLRQAEAGYWNEVSMAVVNAGGLRAPLQAGPLTVEDILLVMPFRNTMDIIELTGKTVLDMFEYGASRWSSDIVESYGGFLQVSGIKIIYDMRRPVGKRVVQVMTLCTKCLIPKYELLDTTKVYKILMSSFVSGGGDGYEIIKNNIVKRHILGSLDSDLVINYVKQFTPIIAAVEGRIQHLKDLEASGLVDSMPCHGGLSCMTSSKSTLVLMMSLCVMTYLFNKFA